MTGRRNPLLAVPVLPLALVLSLSGACGPTPSPPPTTANAPAASSVAPQPGSAPAKVAEAADPPMPELRTGPLVPIDHSNLLATLPAQKGSVLGEETWRAELPTSALPPGLADYGFSRSVVVTPEQSAPSDAQPYSFAAPNERRDALVLWVKRSSSEASKALNVDLFFESEGATPGEHFRVKLQDNGHAADSPALTGAWTAAFADHLRDYRSFPGAGAWFHFAADRVRAMVKPEKAGPNRTLPRPERPNRSGSDELSFLMETTTGMTSIQETLQSDRALFITAAGLKPSIPISKLSGPPLAQHPFREMLRALGRAAPAEPLAQAAPAEFYYLRFADLPSLFRLIDEADTWGTPLGEGLDGRAEERGVTARYEAELGINRGPLSRMLGPEAIDSLAVMGSDPYIKEGSDVTVVFRIKRKPLFDAGLASALGALAGAHGAVKTETKPYEGTDIRITRSADGSVRQHRATSGDLEIVSNSMNATRRVLDTLRGKHPRLSDEPDFQFMLARDAGTRADALAFMGDRFVAEVIGPRQKILEARRQMALADLMTPGYAALLHGWVHGKSPSTVDDLVKSGALHKEELKHGSGEPIEWKPGQAPRSSWGTPSAMVPLIDLPDPSLITEIERGSYERFARGYQDNFSTYIDPAMLRIAFDSKGGDLRMTADLRILPLIDASEYREIAEIVGTAKVAVPPLSSGARAVLGVGAEARVRREIGRLAGGVSRRHSLSFDFLGDWAMIGAADRSPLARALADLEGNDLPQRPPSEKEQTERADEMATLGRLPLFAAVAVRSTAGVAIALGAVRKVADDVMPGMIEWGKGAEYRGVSIVRVSVREDEGKSELNIFYAVSGGALFASLQENVLRSLIDDQLDGRWPRAVPPGKPATGADPQLVIDLAGKERGPLWHILAWALTEELLDADRRSRDAAAAVLYGVPEASASFKTQRAIALAYFGAIPVPPEGGSYSLAPDGVRDPLRGSRYAPTWPAVPVPGSPVDKVMAAIRRFRAELAFDDEGRVGRGPSMQSLHARVTLGLRSE